MSWGPHRLDMVMPSSLTSNSIEVDGTLNTWKLSGLPCSFNYDTDSLRRELRQVGFEPGPITKTTKRVYLRKLYDIKMSLSRVSSLPRSFNYDTDSLRKELQWVGFEPGPITKSTKRVYLRKLYDIKKNPAYYSPVETSDKKVFSNELQKTLRNANWSFNLIPYRILEETVSQQFANPEPWRKWREGVNKSSFTYLLLDPRVTQNLPCRADGLTESEQWAVFLESIFYVGKGKRSRPYQHLYEAVAHLRGATTTNIKKLQKILDIWADGRGVVCLHVFQNVIPAEAYTREAAMIGALKLENLENIRPGDFYGVAATWGGHQKRNLGVYLLHKAMKIFLQEGERQLSPFDIN